MKAHQGIPERQQKSVYLPREVLNEMRTEAAARGCTLSSLVREAWRIARPTIAGFGDRSAA